MAAQLIYRDEFNEGLSRLYADITRYLDARLEAINRQTLFDRSETQRRLGNIERDVTNIIAFQQTQIETFKGFATDILKQMAAMQQQMNGMQQQMNDGFAAQAERHNELMVRVERIERRLGPAPETE